MARWHGGPLLGARVGRRRVLHRRKTSGGIHIPPLEQVWDYEALEDELWFDWLDDDHPFHLIRPIDRFADEAYAVLWPVPRGGSATRPAEVAYHGCGELLVPLGLSYREWLEELLRARGVAYWLGLKVGRPVRRTWVEEGIERMAELFPDFDPSSMSPSKPRTEIDT